MSAPLAPSPVERACRIAPSLFQRNPFQALLPRVHITRLLATIIPERVSKWLEIRYLWRAGVIGTGLAEWQFNK